MLLSLACLLAAPASEAVYKVKKKPEKPVFANPQEERTYRLRHGEIMTEGGYLDHGVRGRMEGMIPAPPEVVWDLFIQSNHWKRYGMPAIQDSRAVNQEIVDQVGSAKSINVFYKIAGNLMMDPIADRKKGGFWTNLVFQVYDIPWPLADRWMIVKTNYDESKISKAIYRAEWTRLAGNVRTVDGWMVLEPFEGDRHLTRMEYQADSDPGISIPKFILRWGLKKTMPGVIQAIRREAIRVYGRPPASGEDGPSS